MDEIFKALGDPTRLRIVQLLAQQGEVCVCRIVDELKMNQPAISQHMAKLKQTGLVCHRKQGQWIFYSLNIDNLKKGPLALLSEIISVAENTQQAIGSAFCCGGKQG
ncbi:MAG: metalloregulator ArsR/SmtB family transcription factor [Armatimonadota bacterium]|nr:metalloregulator ArsR/SmtB family transcription factor [bacterium]